MTETPSDTPSHGDPGQRGRLVIHPRAVEHIASYAVTDLPGVLRLGSGLDSVIGRRYPKVEAHVAGDHIKLQLEIAVAWPRPLAGTAQAARGAAHEQVERLTGLVVDAVHVTVATVTAPETPDERRVQ